MKINVTHVAKLANLSLTPEEVEKFDQQLAEVLTYIEKLNEVDITGVEPTSQVTGLETVTREDTVSASLPQKDALSNAKSQQDNSFRVKGILSGE